MKNKTKRRKTKTKRRIKRNTRRMVGGSSSLFCVLLNCKTFEDGVEIINRNEKPTNIQLFQFNFEENKQIWSQTKQHSFSIRNYPFGYLGEESTEFVPKGDTNPTIKKFPDDVKAQVLAKLNILQDRPDNDGIDIIIK
jgi:hypothetical protein